MDFWDTFFDSDHRQRRDIESLRKSEAARKRAENRNLRSLDDQQARIEALEQQFGELRLVCQTLLTTLKESGTVKPEQISEVMHRIDAADGVVDGQSTPRGPDEPPSNGPQIRAW